MRDREQERWENTGGSAKSHKHDKDPRIWNKEEYQRLELESFSVFVDNLPADISERELFNMFKWIGRIIDIYLSRKNKNGHVYLFAFVRYTTKGGALKAAAEMNSIVLRGRKLFVGEAKYRRRAVVQSTRGKEVKGSARESDRGNNP
ncbi:uncharacterized protein LOC107472810 [Arachis duranensis]|uniref:Uncharacterized protein LOC107472810 n=1 Tax=Arachis duranensis TaxID=130453 RepID=A0A6P4BX61_ARADU|nr:uncharacterized protein LOC107472810 [Arachis duranensis]